MANEKGEGLRDRSSRREIWTFMVPVANLELTKAVDREFKMERVSFVHKDRLPYVRKKHGLGVRVSELKKKRRGRGTSFFNAAETYAVVRQDGTRAEVEHQCLKIVQEELTLLSVSELGYGRRGQGRPVVPKGEEVHSTVSLLSVRSRDSAPFYRFGITSPLHPIVLDWRWKRFQDQVLFTNLRKILQRKTKVEKSWREDLRRTALLVGESVGAGANDRLKSFIWNMAALETLLTKQDQENREKTERALSRRAEALLGWVVWGSVEDEEGQEREVSLWEAEAYERQLRDCVQKRNSFLHSGKRDDITEEHLAFTDLLLLNILANLVRFPKLFPSKDKVIEFSKKLEAERTLEIKPPRVRPNGLAFFKIRTIRSREAPG